MEVTLEGSNSAETPPPWDGVARGHRPVTGNQAVWRNNHFFLSPPFVFVNLFSFYYLDTSSSVNLW